MRNFWINRKNFSLYLTSSLRSNFPHNNKCFGVSECEWMEGYKHVYAKLVWKVFKTKKKLNQSHKWVFVESSPGFSLARWWECSYKHHYTRQFHNPQFMLSDLAYAIYNENSESRSVSSSSPSRAHYSQKIFFFFFEREKKSVKNERTKNKSHSASKLKKINSYITQCLCVFLLKYITNAKKYSKIQKWSDEVKNHLR